MASCSAFTLENPKAAARCVLFTLGIRLCRLYKHAKSNGADADGDCGDHEVRRRVDHRYGLVLIVGDIDLAAVGVDCHADGAEADADRVDHLYGVRFAVGDIDLAAVGGYRHAEGAAGDGVASRGDDRVRGRVDHRYGAGWEGEALGDVDRAAVGAHRHAEGPGANEDRGDDRVRRRVNHRYGVRALVRDVGVLGAYRRRTD